MWKAAAAAFAALCTIGKCSADCTTVEGHECCTFRADDSHAQNCGRIGPVLPGDDKQACGQHCLENDSCFWTYSAGGDYAGDCELLGPCGERGETNRPFAASDSAAGTMHSAGCFSWGDAEPVPSAPLSLMSMIMGFGIALLVFGLPATWWMRKSCKANKSVRRGTEPADVENGTAQPQRHVPSIKNVARAIIHAQRAMDDLQRGMLRSMVAEMERQSAQQLAQAQSVQIKGTRGERREALRQKHRHQRAALANQLDAVDMGLNKILQDQGVSDGDAALSPRAGTSRKEEAELARTESRKVLAQYDQHVEEMSKQLKKRASSQSENLEKKLEEKRELMKARLLQMEQLMERQGLNATIVQKPGAAEEESTKKRQSRAVAVQKLDLTGDGNAESVGYDTNGDGVVDAIDYDGDGKIDAYLEMKEERVSKPEFVPPGATKPSSPQLSVEQP